MGDLIKTYTVHFLKNNQILSGIYFGLLISQAYFSLMAFNYIFEEGLYDYDLVRVVGVVECARRAAKSGRVIICLKDDDYSHRFDVYISDESLKTIKKMERPEAAVLYSEDLAVSGFVTRFFGKPEIHYLEVDGVVYRDLEKSVEMFEIRRRSGFGYLYRFALLLMAGLIIIPLVVNYRKFRG